MFLDPFNVLIEIREKICNKKVIIFGSSVGGKRILFTLLQMLIKPNYFVDNCIETKHKKTYLDYNILNPEVLLRENKKEIAILIASFYDKEISAQLAKMGFEKNKHFFSVLMDSKKEDERKKENDRKTTEETSFSKKIKHRVIISDIPKSVTLGKNVGIYKDVIIEHDVKIGDHTYIMDRSYVGDCSTIGKYCSIAENVTISASRHTVDFLSTSPSLYPNYNGVRIVQFNRYPNTLYEIEPKNVKTTFKTIEPVIVGNDVWIGRNAVIQGSVKIGDGAVIGSGAVVTKDVPPYAIVVGVPAVVKKYRFSPEIIKTLLKLEWWNMPEDLLLELPTDIEECIKVLNERKSN